MKKLFTFILVVATTALIAQNSISDSLRYPYGAMEHSPKAYYEQYMQKHLLEREKTLFVENKKPNQKAIFTGKANNQDSLALVALYNATNGPGWTNNTNWLAGNVADWYGVQLDSTGRVSIINLYSNNLSDSIPIEIGNLTGLTTLNLSNNQLTGSIPPELGNLTSLTTLYLFENQLSGNIPVELGNLINLTWLDLYSNQLTGTIPAEIGNLTNLTWLSFGENQLSGSIPAVIGNLTSLTSLNLYVNQLSGSIPIEIGNLTSLTSLYLYNNQLTGNIPAEIVNLTSLTELDLGSNQLTGSIPIEIGNLTSLTWLYLYENQLSGNIPAEIGNLTSLVYLALEYNQLTGSIPVVLGNLTSLTRLYLHNNQLSGSIPIEIGNLTSLTLLSLGGNQLSGTIPVELGNLTSLTSLNLEGNQLSGSIPLELGNLTSLTSLNLKGNQLSGSIPTELGNLTSLTWLYLDDNQISGSIPAEIGNLTSLTWLYLYENQLSGSIPTEIGNLTSLKLLWLQNNKLTGSIPAGLGNLTALTYLQLYDNQFDELPDVTGLTNMNSWTLHDNKFTFEDIEPNINVGTTFTYAPQDSVGVSIDTTLQTGSNFSYALAVGGTANVYQWYKNDIAIPGATDSLLVLNPVSLADSGRYHLEVTNTIATQLTLYSRSVVLRIEGDPAYDIVSDSLTLVALYNATDGPNWTTNTNWLTGNVVDWYGVQLDSTGRVSSVSLPGNLLSGNIPAEIGNLTNLTLLNLEDNQLSGSLPKELGILTNLEWLISSDNQLSDSIPVEIGNLLNLTILDLAFNQLSGNIPSEFGNLTNLTRLYLGNNQLISSIPMELGNLTSLEYLWLPNNQLSGTIPVEIGNLASLTRLNLYNNQLSGSIPKELGNVTNLTWLFLGNNQLIGSIPKELGNLTSLTQLALYNNQLSDTIPVELGNLTSLTSLYLSQNQFEELPDLTGLTNIIQWSIHNNKLTFEDIEPNINVGPTFTYAPQDSIGISIDTTLQTGSSFSYALAVGGTANVYQWYKDAIAIPGATDSILVLNPVTLADSGRYHLEVTNTIATQLTLFSRPIAVHTSSSTCPVPGNFEVIAQQVSCALPTFMVPVEAINPVNSEVIGLDFCLSYDTTYMQPTGNATIGNVAHGGNPSIVSYYINTGLPGTVNGLIYFNGSAPFPSYFSGNGTVIEIEFQYMGNVPIGTNMPVQLCGITESTLFSGDFFHCNENASNIEVINDTIFTGTLKFWGKNNKRLPYDSLNPGMYLPTTIGGSDSLCNSGLLPVSYPDLNGQFNYDISQGDHIIITRDIPGQYGDTTSCTNVMAWINGSDQNRALKIATMDPTFTPSVYQIIAADVNQDGKVSAADVTFISARAVMSICGFTTNGVDNIRDWLFIDKSTINNGPAFAISANYPNDDGIGFSRNRVPEVPYCLPLPIGVNGQCNLIANEDYAAILMGDVSGNWKSPDASKLKSGNVQLLNFDFDQMRQEGNVYYLPLVIQPTDVEALDFYLNFDNTKLEIEEIIPMVSGYSTHYHVSNDNRFMYSSHALTPQYLSGSVLELKIQATEPPNMNDFVKAMSYINSKPSEIISQITGFEPLLDPDFAGQWNIYPNPLHDQLIIGYNGNRALETKFSLMDVTGRIIYSTRVNAGIGYQLEIPVEDFPNGLFILEISTKESRATYKLIKK